jgi:2-dehydropantoate 2-reductase
VPGILDLGRYPRGSDDVAGALAARLRSAGFLSEVSDDIMAAKYRKLIANLANGVTAAFRPGPESDELAARARAEGEQVLRSAGITFLTPERDAARRGNALTGRVRADYYSSTWQSVARGRGDVETDYLNGEIVLQARLLGHAAPANELIQRITAEHARRGLPPRSLDAAEALAQLSP